MGASWRVMRGPGQPVGRLRAASAAAGQRLGCPA
jgi:hypothetical protein